MNNPLLHFTGRNKTDDEAFSVINSILEKEELWLSFCPVFAKEKWQKEVSMVCFTSLPLTECRQHVNTFGEFAVAFNRNRFIDYGAAPVLYATPKHYAHFQNQLALLDSMKDSEKDRDWKEKSEPYSFTEDQTFSLYVLSGLLQEYAYKQDLNRLNYEQNEWRIVSHSLPVWDHINFNPGESKIDIESEQKFHITMKVSRADIEYFVVPKRFEINAKQLSNKLSIPFKILP